TSALSGATLSAADMATVSSISASTGGQSFAATSSDDLVNKLLGIIQAPPATVHESSAFRFFDTHDGGHFFTTSTVERDTVLATRPDMKFEGVGFQAFDDTAVDGSSAVYRFFDTHDGGHFFTVSADERDQVLATRPDMKFEGVGYYQFSGAQG